MNEVELKILEINRPEIEKKLIELGAKKVFDDIIDALIIDFEDNKISNNKSLLRLRKEGNLNVLTFKSDCKDYETIRSSNELEVTFSEFETMKLIFEKLGFKISDKLKKHRISYKLGNVKFEFDNYLDEYDYVPEFLEIESNNEKDVYKHVELLGFSKEDCSSYNGLQVIKYYKK